MRIPTANDNGSIQVPALSCGEMAIVISCVLAAKARKDVPQEDLQDLETSTKKLIQAFMEQAQ